MEKRFFLKNYIYHLSSEILIIIVPLITTPYVSRVLHPSGMGVYTYTWTITMFFSLFAALGINTYGQREIAYHQDNIKERSAVFWELFIIKSITSVFVIISFSVLMIFMREYRICLLIHSISLFAVLIDILWFFKGIEDFRSLAIRTLAIKVASIILIFSFVRTENDLPVYILINTGSVFLANAVMFIGLKGKIEKKSFSELKFRRHIRGIIEYFLPVLAVQLYTYIDRLMLGMMDHTAIENGYYEQARKITELELNIIKSISTVLFSRISFLFANRKDDEIRKLFIESFRVMALIALPIIPGMMIVSDNFVTWFFGSDYMKVALLIKLSGLLVIFMCVGNFVGVQYLNSTGQQNKGTAIYALSAVVNILLNLILIPKYFSVGAIIASNIAECIACGLQVHLLKKSGYNFSMQSGIWKYIISSAIMCFAILSVTKLAAFSGIVLTAVQIITGGIVYFICLYILKDDIITTVTKKLNDNGFQ